MFSFQELTRRKSHVLFEGAVIERLRRGSRYPLDPRLLNAPWVYSAEGSEILRTIYTGYIECGRRGNLPTVILTPTWRANPERLAKAGYLSRDVNGDCFRFLSHLRSGFGTYSERIYIGGLMGCRGDAYDPREALPADEALDFHREQSELLSRSGIDFLYGSTLPALSEATGIAEAMSGTGSSYVLSFVLRPEGTLLDGTMLSDAIRTIDAAVSPPPLFYMINCVHPEIFRKAVTATGQDRSVVAARVAGLQANTSKKPPEKLDGSMTLDGEEPTTFGRLMAALSNDFSLRCLGGCCGTDERHIEAIVQSLSIREEGHV